MATRYIIGNAELLTHEIPAPKKPMDKAHPYSLADAKLQIIPPILNSAVELQELPKQACPAEIAVAKVDLHPAYIAKSYFPTSFSREAGLTAIGSRTIRVKPRKDLRKKAPPESETTQLFVAGSRGAFSRLPSLHPASHDHEIVVPNAFALCSARFPCWSVRVLRLCLIPM